MMAVKMSHLNFADILRPLVPDSIRITICSTTYNARMREPMHLFPRVNHSHKRACLGTVRGKGRTEREVWDGRGVHIGS